MKYFTVAQTDSGKRGCGLCRYVKAFKPKKVLRQIIF